MVRFFIALAFVAVDWIVWRNISQARYQVEQRKAWDAPLREGHVAILVAERKHWWWFSALVVVTVVVCWMLYERMRAGTPLSDAVLHTGLTLTLLGASAWRFVQLTERVVVTYDRIASSNILGTLYDLPLSDLTAVSETDRTALIAFADGRVLELSPWLEGRFWLARELRARMEART